MTEIAPYTPPGSAEIDYTWNLASKLCKTEFVPANLRNKPEAVLAVFLTGRELGIGPMQSLRDIYPVNGRPALMASLMVARVRGLGHRFKTLESNDTLAYVQIHRKGEDEPEPPVKFALADAQRAGLTDKAVWRQYPKAMLWNRAAAAACRRDCPEALGGAVYTPEEIEDGHGTTTATWGAPEPDRDLTEAEAARVAEAWDRAKAQEKSGAGSRATPSVSGDGADASPAPGDQSGAGDEARRDAPQSPHSSARPAPDPTSNPPSPTPPGGGGSDPTSGEGERETVPGRGGAADPPTGEVADRDDPSPDDQGGGPADDAGGKPVPTAGPTPPPFASPVMAWCEQHGQDIRVVKTWLRRVHGTRFPEVKDRKDLEELRPPRSDEVIAVLDEWQRGGKA